MNAAEAREIAFYRKRLLSPLSFSIGILLFLLPFVDFKCNSVTITNATGVDLLIGRVNEKKLKEFAVIGDQKARFSKSGETRPSPYAIAALVFACIGLVASVLIPKKYFIAAISGLLASLSLLMLLIFVQNRIDHYIKSEESFMTEDMKLSADFTFWYYISFFSFLAASFFAFKRGGLTNRKFKQPASSFLKEYNERINKEEKSS